MESKATLDVVCRVLDSLVRVGDRYHGLLPSAIDLSTHEMLAQLATPIEGQRPGDRAPGGSNLMHDQHLLKVLRALGPLLGRADYTQAADRYLQRFATHCTDTETGLFPWGEHAYWDLVDDRVGDSHRCRQPDRAEGMALHDHLRQAPLWLWEALHAIRPPCVERFANGLEYHFKEGAPREYIRHAHIQRHERLERGDKSADFPRHGGFYLLDWAFAHGRSGRAELVQQMEAMVDYWWPHRDEAGRLMIHTRCPADVEGQHQVNSITQTLSLAASLLETAPLLDAEHGTLAARMRRRAAVYIDGFLSASHDLDAGRFVASQRRTDGVVMSAMSTWGSVYGQWPLAYQALIALCAYRLTSCEGLLDWARAAGQEYVSQPFPDDLAVPAMDAGLAVELLADLFDVTGERHWLEHGQRLAAQLIEVYVTGDLVRAAPGADYYESQTVPGDLVHGLTRLALLADGESEALTSNYTCR
jgi:hypothetical protein